MRARVFTCKRVRVRVPVSFPSAPGSPAALALQHGAAVSVLLSGVNPRKAVGVTAGGDPMEARSTVQPRSLR